MVLEKLGLPSSCAGWFVPAQETKGQGMEVKLNKNASTSKWNTNFQPFSLPTIATEHVGFGKSVLRTNSQRQTWISVSDTISSSWLLSRFLLSVCKGLCRNRRRATPTKQGI